MKKGSVLLLILALLLTGCTAEKGKEKTQTAERQEGGPDPSVASEELSDIEAYLLSLPDDPKESDAVIFGFNGFVNGEKWETFRRETSEGKNSSVTIATFTIEGDPIYTYLSFDGNTYTAVMDTSRDKFGKPEMIHVEKSYLYEQTYVEEESINGVTRRYQHMIAFLSDEELQCGSKGEEDYRLSEDDFHLWSMINRLP